MITNTISNIASYKRTVKMVCKVISNVSIKCTFSYVVAIAARSFTLKNQDGLQARILRFHIV